MLIQPLAKAEFFQQPFFSETAGLEPNSLFEGTLKKAVEELQSVQSASQNDGYQLALGETDNLSAMMIRSQKAELMLDTAVQLTARAVSAYKEMMQMQI